MEDNTVPAQKDFLKIYDALPEKEIKDLGIYAKGSETLDTPENYWEADKNLKEEFNNDFNNFESYYNDAAAKYAELSITNNAVQANQEAEKYSTGTPIIVPEAYKNVFLGTNFIPKVITPKQFLTNFPLKMENITLTGRYRLSKGLSDSGFSERHIDPRSLALMYQDKIKGPNGELIINSENREDFLDYVLLNEQITNEQGKKIKAVTYNFDDIDYNTDWSSLEDVPLFKAVYVGETAKGEKVNYFDAIGMTKPSLESDWSEAGKGVLMSILKAPVNILVSLADATRGISNFVGAEGLKDWAEGVSTVMQDFGAAKSIEGQQSFMTLDNIVPLISDIAIQVLISRGAGLVGSSLGKAITGTGTTANIGRSLAANTSHLTMASMATAGSYDRALEAGFSENAAAIYGALNFAAIAKVSQALDWFTTLPMAKQASKLAAGESRMLVETTTNTLKSLKDDAALAAMKSGATEFETQVAVKASKNYLTKIFSPMAKRYKPNSVAHGEWQARISNSLSESLQEYNELFAEVAIDKVFNLFSTIGVLETGKFETGWERLVNQEALLNVIGGFGGGLFAAYTMGVHRPKYYANHLHNVIAMGEGPRVLKETEKLYKEGKLGPDNITVNRVDDGKGGSRFQTVAEARAEIQKIGGNVDEIVTLNDYAYRTFLAEYNYLMSIHNKIGAQIDQAYQESPLLKTILDNTRFVDKIVDEQWKIAEAVIEIDRVLSEGGATSSFVSEDLANVPAMPDADASREELETYSKKMSELREKYNAVPDIKEHLNTISKSKTLTEAFSSQEGSIDHLKKTSIELTKLWSEQKAGGFTGTLDDYYDNFKKIQALTKEVKLRGEAGLALTEAQIKTDFQNLVDTYSNIDVLTIDDLINFSQNLKTLIGNYSGYITEESAKELQNVKAKIDENINIYYNTTRDSILSQFNAMRDILEDPNAEQADKDAVYTRLQNFFLKTFAPLLNEDNNDLAIYFRDIFEVNAEGELSTVKDPIKLLDGLTALAESMLKGDITNEKSVFSVDNEFGFPAAPGDNLSFLSLIINDAQNLGLTIDQNILQDEIKVATQIINSIESIVDANKINAVRKNLENLNTYKAFFQIINPVNMSVNTDYTTNDADPKATPLHSLVDAIEANLKLPISSLVEIEDVVRANLYAAFDQISIRLDQIQSLNALINDWSILEFQSDLIYSVVDPKGKFGARSNNLAFKNAIAATKDGVIKDPRKLIDDFDRLLNSEAFLNYSTIYNTYIEDNINLNPQNYFKLKQKLLGVNSKLKAELSNKEWLMSKFLRRGTPKYLEFKAKQSKKEQELILSLEQALYDENVFVENGAIQGLDAYPEIKEVLSRATVNNLTKEELAAFIKEQESYKVFKNIRDEMNSLANRVQAASKNFDEALYGIDQSALFHKTSREVSNKYHFNILNAFFKGTKELKAIPKNVDLDDLEERLKIVETSPLTPLEKHEALVEFRKHLRSLGFNKEWVRNSVLGDAGDGKLYFPSLSENVPTSNFAAISLFLATDEDEFYSYVDDMYKNGKETLWTGEQEIHGLYTYAYLNTDQDIVSGFANSFTQGGFKEATFEPYLFLEGVPGSGKTSVVSTVVNKFSKYDKIIYTAPDKGRADLINQKQTGYDPNNVKILKDNITELDSKTNDELSNIVLVVDEATLMEPKNLTALKGLTKRGLKLVMMGDTKQINNLGDQATTIARSQFEIPKLETSIRSKVSKLTEFFINLRKAELKGGVNKQTQGIFNFAASFNQESTYGLIEHEDPNLNKILGGIGFAKTNKEEKINQALETLKGKKLEVMIAVNDGDTVNKLLADKILATLKEKGTGYEDITIVENGTVTLNDTMGREADYVFAFFNEGSFSPEITTELSWKANAEINYSLFNTVTSRGRYFTLAINDVKDLNLDTDLIATEALTKIPLVVLNPNAKAEDLNKYKAFVERVKGKNVATTAPNTVVTQTKPVQPTVTPADNNEAEPITKDDFEALSLEDKLEKIKAGEVSSITSVSDGVNNAYKVVVNQVNFGPGESVTIEHWEYNNNIIDSSTLTDFKDELEDLNSDSLSYNDLLAKESLQDDEDLKEIFDAVKNLALKNKKDAFEEAIKITEDIQAIKDELINFPDDVQNEFQAAIDKREIELLNVALKDEVIDEYLKDLEDHEVAAEKIDFLNVEEEEVGTDGNKAQPITKKYTEDQTPFYATTDTTLRHKAANRIIQDQKLVGYTPYGGTEAEAKATYEDTVKIVLQKLSNKDVDNEIITELYVGNKNPNVSGPEVAGMLDYQIHLTYTDKVTNVKRLVVFDAPVDTMRGGVTSTDMSRAHLEQIQNALELNGIIINPNASKDEPKFKYIKRTINSGSFIIPPGRLKKLENKKQKSYIDLVTELKDKGYVVNGPFINTTLDDNKRGEVFITYQYGQGGKSGAIYLNSPVLTSYDELYDFVHANEDNKKNLFFLVKNTDKAGRFLNEFLERIQNIEGIQPEDVKLIKNYISVKQKQNTDNKKIWLSFEKIYDLIETNEGLRDELADAFTKAVQADGVNGLSFFPTIEKAGANNPIVGRDAGKAKVNAGALNFVTSSFTSSVDDITTNALALDYGSLENFLSDTVAVKSDPAPVEEPLDQTEEETDSDDAEEEFSSDEPVNFDQVVAPSTSANPNNEIITTLNMELKQIFSDPLNIKVDLDDLKKTLGDDFKIECEGTAADGWISNFTSGRDWILLKELKGPSHAGGGIDLEVEGTGVKILKNGGDLTKGLILAKYL